MTAAGLPFQDEAVAGDPYHNIPLNENLLQPVIDLPIPDEAKKAEHGKLFKAYPGSGGS